MAVITRLEITHGNETAQSIKDDILPENGDTAEWVKRFTAWLSGFGAGLRNATIKQTHDDVATDKAAVVVTFVYATVADQDTMVIGGVTLKAVTGAPAVETEFRKVTDLATLIANFCTTFNAHSTLSLVMSAAVTGTGEVTITYKEPGISGNYVQCARETGTGWTFATAALAGGGTTLRRTYKRGQ